MTQTASKRLAVSFAALAAAGVIGGVTAVSLLGQQEQPARQVTTVSDEASTTPTTATASPVPVVSSPTVQTTAPAATPTKGPAKSTGRSQTVTDPTEPAPTTAPTTEPPAPPGNTAPTGVETPPVGDPPPPFPTMSCLPHEVNDRCPPTAQAD